MFRNHHPRVSAYIGKIIRQTKYEDIREEDERRLSKEEEKKKKKKKEWFYTPHPFEFFIDSTNLRRN